MTKDQHNKELIDRLIKENQSLKSEFKDLKMAASDAHDWVAEMESILADIRDDPSTPFYVVEFIEKKWKAKTSTNKSEN